MDGISAEAAQHIALRLGARDAFPMADQGFDDERWRPWRALATVHLLAEARSQARSAFSNQ